MDLQKAFNTAYLGIIAQGALAKNFDSGGCFYLQPETGYACGVGQLLTPERRKEFHDRAVGSIRYGYGNRTELVRTGLEEGGFPIEEERDLKFLQNLQDTHDNSNDLDEFRTNMANLAKNCNLEIPNEVQA